MFRLLFLALYINIQAISPSPKSDSHIHRNGLYQLSSLYLPRDWESSLPINPSTLKQFQYPLASIRLLNMPESTFWYCKHCGFGPMTENTDYCLEFHCQRRRDRHCKTETHETHPNGGRRATMADFSLLNASLSFSSPCFGSSMPNNERISLVDFNNDHNGARRTTTHGEGSPAIYGSSVGGGYITYGDKIWFCCHCGDGPKGTALQEQCVICYHNRCYRCTIQ